MNFNFDRMSHLAGIETEEKPRLKNSEVLNESDETKIRKIIREELKLAMHTPDEQQMFDAIQDNKSLAQAIQFASISKYGKINPTHNDTQGASRITAGFVGGLGFH
jgi:hypothetical protein